MQKYMIRLKENYYEGLRSYYLKQDIHIVFVDSILPDFMIIETNESIEELRQQPLFRSVEKERIGSVNV